MVLSLLAVPSLLVDNLGPPLGLLVELLFKVRKEKLLLEEESKLLIECSMGSRSKVCKCREFQSSVDPPKESRVGSARGCCCCCGGGGVVLDKDGLVLPLLMDPPLALPLFKSSGDNAAAAALKKLSLDDMFMTLILLIPLK